MAPLESVLRLLVPAVHIGQPYRFRRGCAAVVDGEGL